MTCCAALEVSATETDVGHVFIGCDSFLGSEEWADKIDRPKWFRRSGVVLAYAGSLHLAQSLEFNLKPWRTLRKDEDPLAYVCRVVVPAIKTLATGSKIDTSFLAVVGGQVIHIGDDLGVSRSNYGYNAIGVGSMGVTTALRALNKLPERNRPTPRDRLRLALEGVVEHTMGVAHPVRVERV